MIDKNSLLTQLHSLITPHDFELLVTELIEKMGFDEVEHQLSMSAEDVASKEVICGRWRCYLIVSNI